MKIRPLSPISLIQTSAQKSTSDNQIKDDIESNSSMVFQSIQKKNSAEQYQTQIYEQQKQNGNQHETFTSSFQQSQNKKKSLKQMNLHPSQKKFTNNTKYYEKIDQRILKAVESINYLFNKGILMQQKQWDHLEKQIQDALNEATQSNQLSSISYTVKKLNINAIQQIDKAGNINQASKILNFCNDLIDNFGNIWLQSNLRNSQLSIPSTQTPKSNGFSSNYEMSKQKLSNQNFGSNFPSILSETLICLKSFTMNNQGTVFRRKGQFQAALEIFNEALNILQNAKRKEYLGLTYLNLSILYSSLGNHTMSLENANNALIEQQRLFYEKNYTPFQQKQQGQGYQSGENFQSLALSPKSSLANLGTQVKENQKQEYSEGSTPKNRNQQILNQLSAQKLNSKEDFSRTIEKNYDSMQEICYSDLYFYEEEREDEFLQQVNTLGISYYNIAAELEYFQRWDEAHRHYEYSYTSTKKYFGDENCITLQFYEEYKLFQSRHAKKLVEDNINEVKNIPQKFSNSTKNFPIKDRPQSQKRKQKLDLGLQMQALGMTTQTLANTITKESERGSVQNLNQYSISYAATCKNGKFSNLKQSQTPSRKSRQYPARHRSLHLNQNTNCQSKENPNQFSHIQNSFQQAQIYPIEQNYMQTQTPTNRNPINFTNKFKRNIVSASKTRSNIVVHYNNQSSNFFTPATPKTSHSRINLSNSNQIIQGPYLFQPSYTASNAFGGNTFVQQANGSSGSYGFQSIGNSLMSSPKNMMLTQQAKNFNQKSQSITNLQAQKANLNQNWNMSKQQGKLIEKIKQLGSSSQKFQFSQIDTLKTQIENTPKQKNQQIKKVYQKNKSDTLNIDQLILDVDSGKSISQQEFNDQLITNQNNLSHNNSDNQQSMQNNLNKKALNSPNNNFDYFEKKFHNDKEISQQNLKLEYQKKQKTQNDNQMNGKLQNKLDSNQNSHAGIRRAQTQQFQKKQQNLQEKLKESANILKQQLIQEFSSRKANTNGDQQGTESNQQIQEENQENQLDDQQYARFSAQDFLVQKFNNVKNKKNESSDAFQMYFEKNGVNQQGQQRTQNKEQNPESQKDIEGKDDVFDLEKSQISNKSLNEENLKKLIKTIQKQNKLQEKDKKFISIILKNKSSSNKQENQQNNNQNGQLQTAQNDRSNEQDNSNIQLEQIQVQNKFDRQKQTIYSIQNQKLNLFSVEDNNTSPQQQQKKFQVGNLTFTLLNQIHLIASFSWIQKNKKQIILMHSFDVSEVYQQIQLSQPNQFLNTNQIQEEKRNEKNGQQLQNGILDNQNKQKVEETKQQNGENNMKKYIDILTQLSKQIIQFLIISPLMNFLLVDSNPSTPNRIKITLQDIGTFSIVNFADDQSLVNFFSSEQQANFQKQENIQKETNQNIQIKEKKDEKQIFTPIQPAVQQQKNQNNQITLNIPLSHNSLSSSSPQSSSSNLVTGSLSNFQQPSQSNNQLALEQIDELEELKPILNHKKNSKIIVSSKSKQSLQEQEQSDISNSSIQPIVLNKYKTRPQVKSSSSLSKQQLSDKKHTQPKANSAIAINPIIKHFQDCSPINNLGSPFVSAYDADPTFTNYLKDITPIVQDNQKNNNVSTVALLQPITQPNQTNKAALKKQQSQETNLIQTPEQQLQQIQAIISHNKQTQNQTEELMQQNQQQIDQQLNDQQLNIQQGLQYIYANPNYIEYVDYLNQINQLEYPQYFNENGQIINQDNLQFQQQAFDDTNLNPYSNMGISQNLQQNNFNNANNINNLLLQNYNLGIEDNGLNQIQQQLLTNNQIQENYIQQMLLPQLSQQQYYQAGQQNLPQYNQLTSEDQIYQTNLLLQQQQQQQLLYNQYQLQQMLLQNQLIQQQSQQQQQQSLQQIEIPQQVQKVNLEQLQTTSSNEVKVSLQKDQSKQSQLQSQKSENKSQLQSQLLLAQDAQNSSNSPSQANSVQSQSKKINSQPDYSQNSYLQTMNSPLKSQDQSMQTKIDQLRLDTNQSNNLTIQKVESQLGQTPVSFSRQTFQLDSNGFEKLNIQNPMISTNNSLLAYDKNSARSLTDLNFKYEFKNKSTTKNPFRNKYQSRASIAYLPSTLGTKIDNNNQRRYSQFYLQTLQKLSQEKESLTSQSDDSSKNSESSNSEEEEDYTQINEHKKDEKDQFQEQSNQNMEVKQAESKIEDDDNNNEQDLENESVILKDSQINKLRSNNKIEINHQIHKIKSPRDNNNNSKNAISNKKVFGDNKVLKSDQDYQTQNENDDCDDDYEENYKIKQQFEKEDVITRVDSDNENNFIQDDYSHTQKKTMINNIQDLSQIKHKRNDYESIRSDDWNELKNAKQIFRNQSNESNLYSYFSANQNISQINRNMNEDGDNFEDLDYYNGDNNYDDLADQEKSGFQSTSQINFTKKNNISSQTSVQSNDQNIQNGDNQQPNSDVNLKSEEQKSQISQSNSAVSRDSKEEKQQDIIISNYTNQQNRVETILISRDQRKKPSVPNIVILKVSTQEDINQEDQSSSDSSQEEEQEQEEEQKNKNFQTDNEESSQELEANNVNSLENLRSKDEDANNQNPIKSFNTNTASNSTISQNDRKQSLKELEKFEKKESKKRESLKKFSYDENLNEKIQPQYSSFRSAGTEQPSARFQSPEKSMQESQGSKKLTDLKLKIEDSDSSPLTIMRGKSESLMIKSEDNRAMTPKIKEKRRDSLQTDFSNFQNQLQILEQTALENNKNAFSLTNIKETDVQRQRRESIKNGIVPDFGTNWSSSNLQSKMAMIEENNADSDNVDSEGEGKFQRRRQSTLAQNRPKKITFESNIRIHAIQQNQANESHDQQSPYFTVNANGNLLYGSQHNDKPSDQQVRGKTFTFDYNYQNDSIRLKGSKSQFHFFQFPSEENIKPKEEQSNKNPNQQIQQDTNNQQQKLPSQTNIQLQSSQNQSILSQQNTPLSSIKSNNDTQNYSATQIFSQMQIKNNYSNSNLDSVSPHNQTTPNHQSSKSNFSYTNINNKNSNFRFEDVMNQNN